MKKILSILQNNLFAFSLLIIYICFRPIWENLFSTWFIQPILSQFVSNKSTSLLFIIASLGFLAYHIVSIRRKEILINKGTIGLFILILYIWGYYRLTTESATHLETFSFLCYVDIIPFLCFHASIRYGGLRKRNMTPINHLNGFLIDRPITQTAHDLLNRTKDAQYTVDKLMATNTDYEAFTFGILASWGEGKTSFMALMEEYLSQAYKNKVIIMKFNPWIYRKDSNLTHIFLEELSQTFKPYSTEFSKGLVRYSEMLLAIDNGWIKTLTKFFISFGSKTAFEQFNLLKENIKTINKKIVIFIDDIDRLNSDEIEEILRLVRNTSNLPNMYFILAYDKKYVVDTLNKHYTFHSIKYMDKILQEEFILPTAKESLLKDLLLQYLKNELSENEYDQIQKFLDKNFSLTQIDPTDYITTIRDAKRIANQFIFSIRKLHDEVDLCDFLTLELFRLRYPLVVKLLIEKRDEVLVYLPNVQRMVCFNGKNTPETNEYANIWGKKKYFNLMEYITNHYHELYINENDIDRVSVFLNALFGKYKSLKIGSINDPHYMNRFFKNIILDSEVSEKEWQELYKLSFEEMKPTIKKWIAYKSVSLENRIQKEHPKSKEEIYKLLHLTFYIGGLKNETFYDSFTFISQLLQNLFYNFSENHSFSQKDREEMHACLTENGINNYVLEYLHSLFDHGTYNQERILTKEEVVEIQSNFLKQYINEGDKPLNYILECWKATAYPEMITNEDGSGNIQYLHSKESKTLMKNYVIKHLEEFIQQIIYINHLDKTKYTISDYVTELWDNWDTFYEYINNIQNESQILFEFNEFLTEFKNNGYTNYINFNFHHIEPKQ